VVFSQTAFSSEQYCEFDRSKEVKLKQHTFDDGDTIVTLTFPKVSDGALHRVDLRYGNIEKFGNHEMYTELASFEEKDGYKVSLNLSGEHKALKLVAIYHFPYCYSTLNVEIKGSVVTTPDHT
jgi:outer membrane cobalamin receptor